ncbi:uncharacterized protein BXIN_1311 [Babesia sp. Xinjiang]|uniref:uncharacterized protein n=1 Tax=Babesia sp. Xinjiang TaxID=462227 RepID=UPI000A25B5F1|nr:uncharacterized protein BXIN_1311 [Babesia sp. Xinjiang]ORM40194.1 hypothetical protein BXIN_1311 [Babesia sp. Xinjiang]
MSNRLMQIAVADTAPPLSADQCLTRRVLATHLANQRLFSDTSQKKTPADMPRTIKPQVIPLDSLRLKSKVKDLCYNCNGSRLFLASREGLTVLDSSTLSPHVTLSVKCLRVLTHPIKADIFALLVMEGTENLRPCVKIFSLAATAGLPPILKATIWSGVEDAWYSGAWSTDGSVIAVVDRGDHLQRVDVSDPKDCELPSSSVVALQSEVYGLIYTTDALVVQKVDGCIDILASDFSLRSSEQIHSHIVLAAAYNRDRGLLATGGSDHTVHLISCEDDYTCVGTFPGLEGKVSSVSFSFDGTLLAWGTKDTIFVGTDDAGGSDGAPTEEYYLTVAGTDPCEIYLQIRMPGAVSHVQFCPDSYTIAYACDLDTIPKGSGTSMSLGLLRLC